METQCPILVLEDMIAAFDAEQPERGRETTAFIERWRKKELALKHRNGLLHKQMAVHAINHAEIESIRQSKKVRDTPRRSDNSFIDV